MDTSAPRWGRDFDPDRLAAIEREAWKAYYRREGPRLFRLLIRANREQAGVDWIRAILAAFWLAGAAARFGRSTGGYDRYEPDNRPRLDRLTGGFTRGEPNLAPDDLFGDTWAEAACPARIAITLGGRVLGERVLGERGGPA